MSDFTGKDARDRVLYINLWFFKYGTNDKVHAAAVVLSIVLLLAIIALIFFGTSHHEGNWDEKAFSWLGGAFLFISGVALGKGGSDRKSRHEQDDD